VCVCVRVAKPVKMQSSNTLSQDTAFDGSMSTWSNWRVTDTQLPPPGERPYTKHGTLSKGLDVTV